MKIRLKNKVFPILFLTGLMYASSDFANASEANLTLGLGSPLTGNQDIYKSNGQNWEQGDLIGTLIISTKCFEVAKLDCSLWHHSIITDTQDVGVTGISITKTWKFNW